MRHLIMIAHVGLLAWMACRQAPTVDETANLAASISYWRSGEFDLYRVNPPLSRLIAGLPMVLMGAEVDLNWDRSPGARPEWAVGQKFVRDHPDDWHLYFVAGRLALLPLMVLGGYVCHAWARELYGVRAGLLALCLWAFSPNLLAWGSTIMPDAAATVLGVLAGYCFRGWLRRPGWPRALLAGLTLGLAELTKMTWVVLFPLWPILWLAWSKGHVREATRGQGGQLLIILLLGVYVIHLGYAFEAPLRPLGDYTFVSRALAGERASGNRFEGTWLGDLPVPLPANYLSGIDLQKVDFEKGMWSYLGGEWRHGGWWYYYLVCAALKVPLGTWLLVPLAIAATFRGRRGDGVARSGVGWREELVLLAPAAVVFTFVSAQTGFSHHFRYVLPCFPFAIVWIGRAAQWFEAGPRAGALVAGLGVGWSVASSLLVFPHGVSYFNELAGGPRNGHHYLIDSNADWGQDLWSLKRWYDAHPQARPFFAAVYTSIELRHFGIPAESPPGFPEGERFDDPGPVPGWYAVSVHRLHDRDGRFDYFQRYFEPVSRIGYSIHLYHITPEAANRVRRDRGLPPTVPFP